MTRGHGFTLVETMLVIAIGMALLFSAAAIYSVARGSAATSQACSKVLALQTLIEQVASAAGRQYPDLGQVSQIWQQRRPNDYSSSPWGGAITHGCPDGSGTPPNPQPPFIAGVAGQGGGGSSGFVECGYQDLAPGTYATPLPPPPGSASVGELDYRRISDNGSASFFDAALSHLVKVKSYAISIRGQDDKDFFYVGGN